MKKILKYGCLSCLTLVLGFVFFVWYIFYENAQVPKVTKEHTIQVVEEAFEDYLGIEVYFIRTGLKYFGTEYFDVDMILTDGRLFDLDDQQEGPNYRFSTGMNGEETAAELARAFLFDEFNSGFKVTILPFEDMKQLFFKPEVQGLVEGEGDWDEHVYQGLAIEGEQITPGFIEELAIIKSLMIYQEGADTIFEAYKIAEKDKLEVRQRYYKLVEQGYFELTFRFTIKGIKQGDNIEDYLNMDEVRKLPKGTEIILSDALFNQATVELEYTAPGTGSAN